MFKHQALPPVPPGHGRSSTSFPHSCPVPAGTVTPVHVVTKRFPSSDKVQEIAVTVTPVHVVTPSAFQAFLPVTKYRGFFFKYCQWVSWTTYGVCVMVPLWPTTCTNTRNFRHFMSVHAMPNGKSVSLTKSSPSSKRKFWNKILMSSFLWR